MHIGHKMRFACTRRSFEASKEAAILIEKFSALTIATSATFLGRSPGNLSDFCFTALGRQMLVCESAMIHRERVGMELISDHCK